MSADNYVYCARLKDDPAKIAVTHRFASVYYSDQCDEPPMEAFCVEGTSEGWKLRGDSVHGDRFFSTYEELEAAATRRSDWIVPPPEPIEVFTDVGKAVAFAHVYASTLAVLEYGVMVHESVVEELKVK